MTKCVPRVSPYSTVSIDPGFVEIGPVQRSQSVKPTNVTHTFTHRHTDYVKAGTLYALGRKKCFLPKAKKASVASLLGFALLLVQRYMKQGGLVLAVGRVGSKKQKRNENRKNSTLP